MTNDWQALGWTLVHFLWQGTAIALIYRLADLALARRSANARYVLALAALLSMPAVALTTLAYEQAHIDQPAVHMAGVIHNVVSTAQYFEPAEPAAALHQGNRLPLEPLMPWLDGLWLAGVVLLSLRALGGWWLVRRMGLRTLELPPHTLRLRLDFLRRTMGIARFVELRLSRQLTNPLTAGVLRPWILLPVSALTSLSPEQIEVVLSHELAHIRRADYLWNLLQTAVETLFFFHPAVWWISRRAREERELCCDDVAVQSCGDPALYAAALLRLEEERRDQMRLAMALDGHQTRAGLRARILRILGDAEERPGRVRPLSLTVVGAAAILFLCPVSRVFASFQAVPAATVAPIVRQVVRPVLRAVHALPAAVQAPTPKPQAATPAPPPPQSADTSDRTSAAGAPSDYIDQMRAAGYDVDLDKYLAMKVQGITAQYAEAMAKAVGAQVAADQLIAMKVQGVTPDYAAAMAKASGAPLTADKLIAIKVQDVTPDYMAQMRAAGYDVAPDKYIAMKVQGITPAYAHAMANLGYGKPTADELIALKVQGVTPEWAEKLHADGLRASSFQDLLSYRIFAVTPGFLAGMQAAGFGAIPPQKLIELRVQGITPDFAKSVRAQFPDATLNDLIQMRIFHIDEAFIASARRHGFAPLTIQKLVKLRISGILDDADATKENRE